MKKKKVGRVLLSFLLTLTMVIGFMPGMGMTAHAAPEETLLTTITPTGQTTYDETTSGVVTVSHNNDHYIGKYGWLWFDVADTLTVSGCEGYTITKVIFKQNEKNPVTDSSAPFELHFCMEDFMLICQENGAFDGVTSIEVYGYVNPTTSAVTLNANGGTINSGNITEYTEGTGATLPTDVTKDGYQFGGWYDNAGLTGSPVTAISTSDTGNKEYWAKWTANPSPVSYSVVFKVVNGSWDDGNTSDKSVTLSGMEGDTLKLSSGQIPAVGTKPNDGYKAGSWDVTPSTDTAISSNVTYTYTYEADTSAKVPYDDVATSAGSVNDITGTASATAESNPFGTKIENNSNLTTLLSLTDAEVAQGVNVWLDIQDMSASVPQTDKTLIQNTSGDYTVGLYLDINLFKKVGSNDATKVTETKGKVKASIVIPESLWKSGRTFEIIRVHDGVATAIAGTYDENTHVFTFETDKFSTYALTYKDPDSSSDSGTPSDSSSSSDSGSSNSSNSTQSTAPKTGDPNDIRVWYLLLIASLGGLGLLGLSKKKEN